MPSGTGKTIALLALIVAYKLARPDHIAKLLYCTRAVQEMEKAPEELKRLMAYRSARARKDAAGGAPPGGVEGGRQPSEERLLGIGLSARRNLVQRAGERAGSGPYHHHYSHPALPHRASFFPMGCFTYYPKNCSARRRNYWGVAVRRRSS